MIIVAMFLIAAVMAVKFHKSVNLMLPLVFTGGALLAMLSLLINIPQIAILIIAVIAIMALCWLFFHHMTREAVKVIDKATIMWGISVLVMFIGYRHFGETLNIDLGEADLNIQVIRLLGAWEFIVRKSLVINNSFDVLFAKNVYLITMLLPLTALEMNNDKSFTKCELLLILFISFIILVTGVDNEFLIMRPYFTNAIMFGAAIVFFVMYQEKRDALYMIGALVMLIGCALENRIGVLSIASMIVAVVVIEALHRILIATGEHRKLIGVGYCIITILVMLTLYAFRVVIIGDDGFRRDVFNAFLSSLFSTERYSFGMFYKFGYVHFLCLTILIPIVMKEIFIGKKWLKMTIVLYVWNVVLTLILGVLYTRFYAYENITRGEYLTDLQFYIQCPVAVTLYFYGFKIVKAYRSNKNK